MEPKDYVVLVRRSWLLITCLSLLGLLGGGAAALVVKPTYESEVQLFVAIQNSGTVQELQQGNTFSQARVQSYVKTVATPAVLQPVIDSLGLSETPLQLAQRIKATSDLNTVLISVTVEDPSPVQAAAIAQATGTSLNNVVDSLERSGKTSESPVKLSVVTPAVAPTLASSPNTKLSLGVGLLGGLIVGLGAAVLRQRMDSRIGGESDLRNITESPVLGRISFEQDAKNKPLITQIPGQSPRAESFRQLRTNLQFATVGQKSTAVLITSSLPGEGKTTTATNMAIALAQAGQSVVLVDADLRRPMVSEYLGLERNVGLTTVLVGSAELSDVLQPWGEENLYVVSSGRIPPNPSELLGSEAMVEIIKRLENTFDVVIIDSPPILPVTDASVLSQNVGGVILVVDSKSTTRMNVLKSLQSLTMVDAHVLGIVLNRLPIKGPDAYSYAYPAYAARSDEVMLESSFATKSRWAGGRRAATAERRPIAGPDVGVASEVTDPVFFDDVVENRTRSAAKFPGSPDQS
ncbi:polysaccharide biosynthesis tyrosine autokinase [Arthrobacter pascens]|uniref:polysaccharide biosynthesis tyrosine autokinase n=1 Tax=Arthrobacter pascens TaxID=1677 RepID=UPI00196A8EFC|nr:polysaccharide biosynthesis tyrosine autokinase [Arthrobacter pascens]MBN3496648.1 polysaccharide biosynthesis tyrosine autokinase [Arthrobacter pascens]